MKQSSGSMDNRADFAPLGGTGLKALNSVPSTARRNS